MTEGTLAVVYPVVRALHAATLLVMVGVASATLLCRGAPLATVRNAPVIDGWLSRLPGLFAWFLLTLSLLRGGLQLASFGPLDTLDAELVRAALTSGEWGTAWIFQTVGAFVLLGLTWLLRGSATIRTRVVLGFGTLFLVAQAGMGHGADEFWRPPFLGELMHFSHLLGAAIWLGTLAVLALAVFPSLRDDDGRPAAVHILERFSVLARVGVAMVVSSGIVLVLTYTTALGELFTTGWGRLLLVKLVGFVGVAAAGYYNWRIITPRLRHRPDGATALHRAVTTELLLAAMVIAMSVVVAAQALPRDG